MRVYMLKVRLQTFLSIPIIQKRQILICDTLVANERYLLLFASLQDNFEAKHVRPLQGK